MGDEGLETFEVSEPAEPEPEPERPSRPERRGAAVAEKRYLCITIVDHTPVIEGTDEESYVNVRIPVALAEAGLRLVPEGKMGKLDPELVVDMIEEGAVGELVNIKDERKSISIRVE
ncbi:MAG: hypothetical protein R6V05_07370 [Candidatus Brocadiia bacterium]